MSSNACGKQQPHALIFCFPSPGHINPMLQLAKRLLDEGFFITFVNTAFAQERLLVKTVGDITKLSAMPNLRLEHIPDGLPERHKRFNEQPWGVVETIAATLALPGPLAKLVRRIAGSTECPPLTCIIADALFTWIQDVADQFGLPRVSLWTTPAHASLAYISQSTLQSLGLIPVQDQSKLQQVVDCIQGIEPIELKDFITFFLVDTAEDFMFQWFLWLCMRRSDEAAWNLGNNLEELEQMACDALKKEVPHFLPIGPLLPTGVLQDDDMYRIDDTICHDWLSQHENSSVIYIAFGSIVSMPEEDMRELILGLEESGAPFLWAIRPDQQGSTALLQLRDMLESEAVQGKPSHRALLVPWAPQPAILAHPSVGAFLTHCGWNSILESIAAGVPMLAWSGGFADQRMNAHYIADIWKIGRRLPSKASARDVKLLISSILGKSAEAASLRGRLPALRQTALAAVSPGGSSRANFEVFINDMYKRAAATSNS